MNNPWNIQQKFELPIHVKEKVINWMIESKKIKQNLRKEWIKNNPLDEDIFKELQQIYDSGYGYKNIAKSLGISYTQCRRLFSHLQINVRTGMNVITEPLREFRKYRVTGERSPWYRWPEKTPDAQKKNEKTGIQGYYQIKSGDYIWLRSTWEYIYVKWMEKNNIQFEYEPQTIKLPNGESYLPDFKLIDGTYIEIKSMFRGNSRVYKPLMARNLLNIKIVIIEDIKPYCESYNKELKEWKQKRLKKLPE